MHYPSLYMYIRELEEVSWIVRETQELEILKIQLRILVQTYRYVGTGARNSVTAYKSVHVCTV